MTKTKKEICKLCTEKLGIDSTKCPSRDKKQCHAFPVAESITEEKKRYLYHNNGHMPCGKKL